MLKRVAHDGAVGVARLSRLRRGVKAGCADNRPVMRARVAMGTSLRFFACCVSGILILCDAANALPFQCAEFGLGAIERPTKPYCVQQPFAGDEYAFESCKSELESYRSKMRNYLDCLSAESNEAVSEFNAVVRSFNCNASGSYC